MELTQNRKECAPVDSIKSGRRVVETLTVDIDCTFQMDMIELITVMSHFAEVISAAVDGMAGVKLDSETLQMVMNDVPFMRFINIAVPIAVICSDLYVAARIIHQRLDVIDGGSDV